MICLNREKGFTLVELMIALALSSVVTAATVVLFQSQQTSYTSQDQVSEMQMDLRIAIEALTTDIRKAGYDPDETDDFAVTNAQATAIAFTADLNTNPAFNLGPGLPPPNTAENGIVDAGEAYAYQLFDQYPDGIVDSLQRNAEAATAENIVGLGFAYAYDNVPGGGDGQLDLSANGNILWAVASAANGPLDILLDTNDDGLIDDNDIEAGFPFGAAPAIPLNRIRLVRVWVLAESDKVDMTFRDEFGVVGSPHYDPYVLPTNWIDDGDAVFNVNRRHRLLTRTINLRNQWLN